MSGNDKLWEQYGLISDKRVRDIVCLLLVESELPQKDIPKRIEVSGSTTYNLIEKMLDADLVERYGTPRDGFIVRLKKFSLPSINPGLVYEKEKGVLTKPLR
jgi:DNA-binding MarR family transcriptional regulator